MNILLPINGTYMPVADYIPTKYGNLAKLHEIPPFRVRDIKGMVDAALSGMLPRLQTDVEKAIFEEIKQDVKQQKSNILDSDKKELAVLKGAASLVNAGQALGNVLRNCDLGEHLTQCIPKEGMSEEQLGETFLAVSGAGDWSKWAKGDLINEFEKRGIPNALSTICSKLNIEHEYQTLSRYARTSASIPLDQRALPNLRFSHYAEISCTRFDKDPVKQKEHISEVLKEASEMALNVAQVREACLTRKGQETAPTPPPVKRYRYLVFTPNCGRQCCAEFVDTEPHTEAGQIVFDLEEQMASAVETSGGFHTWLPIPHQEAQIVEETEVLEEV